MNDDEPTIWDRIHIHLDSAKAADHSRTVANGVTTSMPPMVSVSPNRLEEQWEQQAEFIKLLQQLRGFPDIPVDIATKQGQKFLKDLTHDCMHELFEANICLKNSKSHRQTEVAGFDRGAYIEELVDALHYLYEIALVSGVTLDELHDAYIAKGKTNVERITGGY